MGVGFLRRWAIVSAALVGVTAASAYAADEIYVDPAGDDAGAGSFEQPLKSIGAAAMRAGPGARVLVKGGTYAGAVRIRCSGTQDAPVLIEAMPGETVVIDGAGGPADLDLVVIEGQHVTFGGFTVRNASRSGIVAWRTQGVTISHNTVEHAQRAGIWVGGERPGDSSSNRVVGNLVRWTALENQALAKESGWPSAVSISLSDHVLVSENVVLENYGEGIGLQSSRWGRVSRNLVHDNFSVNIYLDNAPFSLVTENRVWTEGTAAFFRGGRPARGILIANEHAPYPMPSVGIVVRHNVLTGVGDVEYGHFERGGGLIDSSIDPNVVK